MLPPQRDASPFASKLVELHALLSVMDYLASLDPARYDGAVEVLASWVESARESGNNAIDLDLGLLSPPLLCERMLALMRHLEEHVPRQWPDGVPCEIGDRVRAYLPPSSWPTAHIVAASARLRGLIERTVCSGRTPDEVSSRNARS